jgi:hypothetical protein
MRRKPRQLTKEQHEVYGPRITRALNDIYDLLGDLWKAFPVDDPIVKRAERTRNALEALRVRMETFCMRGERGQGWSFEKWPYSNRDWVEEYQRIGERMQTGSTNEHIPSNTAGL